MFSFVEILCLVLVFVFFLCMKVCLFNLRDSITLYSTLDIFNPMSTAFGDETNQEISEPLQLSASHAQTVWLPPKPYRL